MNEETPKRMDGSVERGNWTSASNAMADSLCIGRHRAQDGIPDDESKDSTFGDEVHAALAKQDASGLTVEQERVYEDSLVVEKKIVDFYFKDEQTNMQIVREHRFWVHWPDGNQHSGQTDVVYRRGTKALIIEYKSLPGEVAASPTNMQLRDQVVLVFSNTTLLLEIATAVVQPLVTHNPYITIYSNNDIERSGVELYDRVVKSNAGGPRTAGQVQCKFCKAKSACVEYSRYASIMTPQPVTLVGVPVALWTPEMRKQFCDHFSVAQKWLDMVWAEMEKGALIDPSFVPGYAMQEGTPREKIVNLQSVFDRASKWGVPLEAFLTNSTISKKDLLELTRICTKHKGKALAKTVEEIIGDDVSVSEVKKSLKQNK